MPQDDPEAKEVMPLPCAILEPPKPESTPSPTRERNPRFPNLVAPWKPGDPDNPGSKRKGKRMETVRSLERRIKDVLHSKNGKKLQDLAVSIVDKAIEGDPVCLKWLGDRLWKLEDSSSQGAKVIFQGIRLELPNANGDKSLEPVSTPVLSVSSDVEGKA